MASELNRREAIKFASMLAVGAGATTADVALGQQADTPHRDGGRQSKAG